MHLADQILPAWSMNREEDRKLLRWASRLHEIGKSICYTGYHRHGSYLVANSEMVGFAREQQLGLAAILLGQRRKLVKARIGELVGRRAQEILRLTIILRLASRLNRTRSPTPRPMIKVDVDDDALHLEFPEGWLGERSLTLGDLRNEASRLKSSGFKLSWG